MSERRMEWNGMEWNGMEWIIQNFEVMNTILSPSDRLHVDTIERPCPVSQWT